MQWVPLGVLSAVALVGFAAVPARAVQVITGHVTMLEATYMPGAFYLTMDAGIPGCEVNELLLWENPTKPQNVQAVYASALAALTSGLKVNFVLPDNYKDPNNKRKKCQGEFFHVTSQR